jgi:molybdenum cofactor guanylyltransferase
MGERGRLVAVLAGGRGQRLGGAKATVTLAGRPLLGYPLEAARDAALEVVVVAKTFSPLPEHAARVLHEPDQPTHPLCGVVRALSFAEERSAHAAVVIVACDMPFVTAGLLAWLAGLEGAAVAAIDGRLQPTLGRYDPSHLPVLREALAAGRALRETVGALSPRIVDERDLRRFGDPARLCFNVNRPRDVRIAEHWLSRPAA